jgi:hypothetical protein
MRPPSSLALCGATLLLAAAAWTAARPAAADGGDTSLIHACAAGQVRGAGAFLRVIGPTESCRPGETPVHWPGSLGDDPPPPPAAARFVIRDGDGSEFGTFGGFSGFGTAFAHLAADGRSFVLNVSRQRVSGLASSALYLSNDCTGTPYLQVFAASLEPLHPLGRTFVRTDAGPPFDVVVQDDPDEAPVPRAISSFRTTEGVCDTTDLPGTSSVTGVVLTFSPVLPFSIGLE